MLSYVYSLELGLADKVEKKYVDLVHGENFKPEFVKIVSTCLLSIFPSPDPSVSLHSVPYLQNENVTLPTLVGPDGTAYKNTTDVVNYLVSIAPVKVKAATEVTALTHEANIDPNFALLSAVSISYFKYPSEYLSDEGFRSSQRNAEELAAKSSAFPKVFVENRTPRTFMMH